MTTGTVQNYTYSYDCYGNRVAQTPLQTGYTFDPTVNPANNQITTSGFSYDAAANMTNDTVHSYTYDAEGNITKVDGGSTAQYVYVTALEAVPSNFCVGNDTVTSRHRVSCAAEARKE